MKDKPLFFLIVLALVSLLAGWFVVPTTNFSQEHHPWRLGLDLVGGSHLVYEIDLSQVSSLDQDNVVNGLKDVIETRINKFGVSEPQVYVAQSGESTRLIVELAGIKDVSLAIKEIGETPFLEFRELGTDIAPADTDVTLNVDDVFVPTELTGRYVEGAQLGRDPVTGQVFVSLLFNTEGDKLFEDITGRNIGSPLAIYLDGELISAPVVQTKIAGGQAQITGLDGLVEARDLVERLNAGALPAPIELVSQQTIGASLGASSLENIIWAGLVGTLLVILFMVIYYGRLGLVASIALLIYIVLLLAIFKLFFTLTLAGIAGILLSIGVAVDANILIFERVKEEVRRGAEFAAAVREGFDRAWPSIRDSNITSIITSLVLYYLTSSFIRGFALSLLLGVLVSMFTAINVTRNLLTVFAKPKR